MNGLLIASLAGFFAAALIRGLLRLFNDRAHRPGPENSWAQRNDTPRESRGPDDSSTSSALGIEIGGEAP